MDLLCLYVCVLLGRVHNVRMVVGQILILKVLLVNRHYREQGSHGKRAGGVTEKMEGYYQKRKSLIESHEFVKLLNKSEIDAKMDKQIIMRRRRWQKTI